MPGWRSQKRGLSISENLKNICPEKNSRNRGRAAWSAAFPSVSQVLYWEVWLPGVRCTIWCLRQMIWYIRETGNRHICAFQKHIVFRNLRPEYALRCVRLHAPVTSTGSLWGLRKMNTPSLRRHMKWDG